jgi:inorganic triphosphatase YgiF
VQARRSEVELKLLVPADFQLPPLKDGKAGVAKAFEEEPLQLRATYFDTPDLRLMKHGITLRYRTGEGNGPIWTLKLPANGDLAERSELEFAGLPDEPPAEARDLLFAFLSESQLAPAAEIRTKRRRWSLADEGGEKLAELVDDRVQILEGTNVRGRFREIEIEAEKMGRKGLERIADRMRKAGAKPEQRSKASRALEALHKLKPQNGYRPSPKDNVGATVRPALQGAFARLLTFDPYARLGEVEGVHQLRVAARRLRSVIRTYKPILDEAKIDPVVEDLRWLGQVLGDVRDLDVLEARLREDSGDEAVPYIAALRARRDKAGAVLKDALNSERYVAFLQRVTALTQDDTLVLDGKEPAKEKLPELVWRVWKKLRDGGRELTPESPEQDFHRARILAKRARYSAETVAVYMPSKQKKRLERFADGAEEVQNILGEHQDAAFARTVISQIASENAGDPAISARVTMLLDKQKEIGEQTRKDFFEAWGDLDRKKNVKWGK